MQKQRLTCQCFLVIENEFDNFDNFDNISISLIDFLSRNRARGEERRRRRCRWGKIWRVCAVALSSLPLSLLSPPPLLQSCPTLQHIPYRGGWRNAACLIPAWYRLCRGLFRQWSIARQWQSLGGAETHGRSPERLSLACGSGTKTRAWRCLMNGMSRRARWWPMCQVWELLISVCQGRARGISMC